MSHGITIIGSGFAARRLVKNIRRQDANVPLTLITADGMDEYNKPDLNHVISQSQCADGLTRRLMGGFAEQFNLRLFPHIWIADIDAGVNVAKSQDQQWQYNKLVPATGASAFVPPVTGRELMLTLSSQQKHRACETQLRDAQQVLIVGGGLIGGELAVDFCRAGRAVTLISNTASILAPLMPPEVSSRLQHRLTDMGVHLLLKPQLQGLEETASGTRATLDRNRSVEVDAVIATTGLRPETALARCTGSNINRGVCAGSYLRTSHPDIYALSDCAKTDDQVLPFLQPIQLSAIYLAKNLLGDGAPLKLPAMLVKVEAPELPLHLAGEAQHRDPSWHITTEAQGMVARGVNDEGQLCAFVVSEDHMKEAFTLLKTLPVQVWDVGWCRFASYPTCDFAQQRCY